MSQPLHTTHTRLQSIATPLAHKLALAAALLTPCVAFAHGGHDLAHTFSAGFSHPWTGLDHWLVLVGVGMWAATRATQQWLAPLAMLLSALLGAALNSTWLGVAVTELLIATSVVAVGLTLANMWTLPNATALGLVSLIGLLHGAAHGAVLTGAPALGGLTLGSAAAIALGWLVARRSRQQRGHMWAGSAMALAGLTMLTQLSL